MSASKKPVLRWHRTIVESVAIIVSILLAFAIDAGWDEIRERNQEKAFLVSLLGDFEEARSRIDECISKHEKFIALANQLLRLHDRDAVDIEPQALETILGAIFYDFESLYLPSGARDALFASDDIEIISNEELRAMLAAWPSRVADAAEDDLLIANEVMNKMAPYLHGKIRTRNVAQRTVSDVANRIPRLEAVNYNVLWEDPIFDNLVTFRMLNESYALRENRRLNEAVDEIIRVIRKELDL